MTNTVIVPTGRRADGSKALLLKPVRRGKGQGVFGACWGPGGGGMGGHPRMTGPLRRFLTAEHDILATLWTQTTLKECYTWF